MRRLSVLGLLLLLVALIAFLLERETDDVTDAPTQADEPEFVEREQLTGAAPPADAASTPGLASRAPPADAPPRTDSGPVTVTVVGPDGTPLPSLFVAIVPTERPPNVSLLLLPDNADVVQADQDGEAVFGDVPYDGSRTVLVYMQDPRSTKLSGRRLLPPAPGRSPAIPVRSERVVYRAAVGIWLQVHVVDAEDGRAVTRATTDVVGAKKPDVDEASKDPRYLVLLNVDSEARVPLKVAAPRDYVAWEPSEWKVPISSYARRLVAVYPLRPEIPVTVSVREQGGEPTEYPVIERTHVAGRNLRVSPSATDAYGRLRLAGVPFLPGEEVRVHAKRTGEAMSTMVKERIPDEPSKGVHLDVVLPPPDPNMIWMSGGAGGSFRGRGSSRQLMASGTPRRTSKGGVLVTVRRRSGMPAAGARVWLGRREARADASGVARFDGVRPGTYAVRAKQVGLLPLAGTVTVRREELARVELREAKGGRLTVVVVDENDRPLSFATLAVKAASGHPWVDLDGDVQRVDPFTDHQGRRILNDIEPGGVTISASWGSRKKTTTVRVGADEEKEIRIVLESAASR